MTVTGSLVSLRDAARKCAESLQDGALPDIMDTYKLIKAIEEADDVVPPIGLQTTLRSAEGFRSAQAAQALERIRSQCHTG